jgi:hypothetical protein
MAHIISMVTASKLLKDGVIPEITDVPPGSISVIFGKETAEEEVVAEITTKGLLRHVLVVNNIAASLISESALTKLGLIFVKDDINLLGFYNNKIILRGYRNPEAIAGTVEQLWNIDLIALFKEPLLDDFLPASVNNENDQLYISFLAFLNDTSKNGKEFLYALSARPRHTQQEVRIARAMIRNCNNFSPYKIAETIKMNAWTDIPSDITPALFTDKGDRRDNILHLITSSRKSKPGGSGIRSDIVGEVCHMDIQGKIKGDKATGTEFLLMILDEATLNVMTYALSKKSSSVDAFRLYDLYLRSYGKRVKKVRTDYASEVTIEYLNTINDQLMNDEKFEILVPFERFHDSSSGITMNKSPPENYALLFERYWQMLKHVGANTILNQDTLTEDFFQWAFMDSGDRLNGLLNVTHPSQTPMERVTGMKPNATQMTAFHYGSLAIAPKVNKSNKMSETNYELVCVVAPPQITPGSHMVLRQGTNRPAIRGGLLQHQELKTKEEWEALQPQFDEKGRMTHFFTPNKTIFSMENILKKYRGLQLTGNDVMTQNQLDAIELYKGRVKNIGKNKSSISIKSNREEADRSMRSDMVASLPVEPLPEYKVREYMQSSCAANPKDPVEIKSSIKCLPTNVNDENGGIIGVSNNINTLNNTHIDSSISNVGDEEAKAPLDQDGLHIDEEDPLYWTVFKARVIRTEDNPTLRQVERSEKLMIKWEPPVRAHFDEGFQRGIYNIITEQQKIDGDFTEIPHVSVFDTKSNRDLKYRCAPDGSRELVSDFVEGSLLSAGIDAPSLHHLYAHCAAKGYLFSTSDAKNAFPNHNRWDDPACKNPRRLCIRISAFESGTGKSELVELKTATNGLRNASNIFEEVFTRNIFEWGGCRSVVSRSLFYRHKGNNGFMAVGVYVDDLAKVRSDNKEGAQMHQELADIFLKNAFTMKDKELADCPDGIDFAGKHIQLFDNEFGTGLALTQPSMHLQIKKNLEELGVEITGEMTYLPILKHWSPLIAEQGLVSNSERFDTTKYLSLLGKLLHSN